MPRFVKGSQVGNQSPLAQAANGRLCFPPRLPLHVQADDRCYGRWLCLNCPRGQHDPPFLPFRFNTHIRQHLSRYPRHRVAFWCLQHSHLAEEFTVPDPSDQLPIGPDPIVVYAGYGGLADDTVLERAIAYREDLIARLSREIGIIKSIRYSLNQPEDEGTVRHSRPS